MNDLKTGVVVEINGEPYQVLVSSHLKMGRGKPVTQTKLKNIRTGRVLEKTFRQSDKIEEADVEKRPVKFLYRTRDEFFFADREGGKYGLGEDKLGGDASWLKKDLPAEILFFSGEPISVSLPIKVSLEVREAPPAVRGDTAQGGTKDVTVETGAIVKTPLFVKTGDTIEINTETGEYVRRV